MIITVDEIVESTAAGFAPRYPHFKEFQSGAAYAPYWKSTAMGIY